MEEDVTRLLLGDMPRLNFIVYFAVAAVGALSSFIFSVIKAIKTNAKTAQKFEWKYLWPGLWRFLFSMIPLALSIAEWDKTSRFLFESDVPVELTPYSAFLMGTLIDRLMEMLFGGGQGAVKSMKRKGATIIVGLIIANGLI